jgi:hypothetical protein
LNLGAFHLFHTLWKVAMQMKIWGNPTNNVLKILEFDSDKPSKKDQGPNNKLNTHQQPILKEKLNDNINLIRP